MEIPSMWKKKELELEFKNQHSTTLLPLHLCWCSSLGWRKKKHQKGVPEHTLPPPNPIQSNAWKKRSPLIWVVTRLAHFPAKKKIRWLRCWRWNEIIPEWFFQGLSGAFQEKMRFTRAKKNQKNIWCISSLKKKNGFTPGWHPLPQKIALSNEFSLPKKKNQLAPLLGPFPKGGGSVLEIFWSNMAQKIWVKPLINLCQKKTVMGPWETVEGINNAHLRELSGRALDFLKFALGEDCLSLQRYGRRH